MEPRETPFEDVFKSIVEHADAKTVYGEPVTVGAKTIVPVARLRYGFGGGWGKGDLDRGGGGGGGLISRPVGVIEITESQTRFIPIGSDWEWLAGAALGVCLGWLAVRTIG